MDFTKEYVELCKNNKIQRLKKKLEYGDWVFCDMSSEFLEDGLIQITGPIPKFNSKIFTWLLTSEQLDYEILNICRKKFNDNFQYEIGFITSKWYGTIRYWKEYEEYMKDNELMRYATEINEDPLICKLRLLITLLREE